MSTDLCFKSKVEHGQITVKTAFCNLINLSFRPCRRIFYASANLITIFTPLLYGLHWSEGSNAVLYGLHWSEDSSAELGEVVLFPVSFDNMELSPKSHTRSSPESPETHTRSHGADGSNVKVTTNSGMGEIQLFYVLCSIESNYCAVGS